jgi:hypothetical protein
MIVESVFTTRDAGGSLNFSPMGVVWGEEEIVVKPYKETTTYGNLLETGQGVVNITDDVRCFARGAVGTPTFPWFPAREVEGAVLEAACSWRELEVVDVDDSGQRARLVARVVHREVRREFVGFNRARAAVIEAAILATRTEFLPMEEIRGDFDRLQTIVDKTGGDAEHEAFDLLADHVEAEAERLQREGAG